MLVLVEDASEPITSVDGEAVESVRCGDRLREWPKGYRRVERPVGGPAMSSQVRRASDAIGDPRRVGEVNAIYLLPSHPDAASDLGRALGQQARSNLVIAATTLLTNGNVTARRPCHADRTVLDQALRRAQQKTGCWQPRAKARG